MAKLSLINRDQKRRRMVKKYARKRAGADAIVNNTRSRKRSARPRG